MEARLLLRLWREEDGQDLVEYSLLLAFLALAAVGVLSQVAGSVTSLWQDISTTMTSAQTAAS